MKAWPHTYNRLLNHVYYYPYHMEWDMETRAPVNWGPIHNYIYAQSIDMNPIAEGSKFYSEKNPKGVTIDGITDEDELKMDYGPQEWAAVSTKWGTIYNHLALPEQAKDLYRDLYYADMVPEAGYAGELSRRIREVWVHDPQS